MTPRHSQNVCHHFKASHETTADIIDRFQVRRAIARALTAAPARIAPEQLVKCSFQRSTLLQSQPCRRFSRIQPRFAEEKPSPPQDKQSTLAEERTEIREEAEVQPEVASEAQEAATEQEYAAVSESTDQIPAGADSSTSTSANAASDQEHAAVSETTDQIPTNHQSSAPAASRFAAPSNGKPASSLADRQLFVSNLYWGVTDADLQSLFQPFGDVRGARVIYGADGRSRGFGFVEMKTVEEVRAAIDGLHETLLEGRAISVKVTQRAHLGVTAQGNRPSRRFTPPSKTLFIGGLSEQMSDADLNSMLAHHFTTLHVS